MKVRRGFVSNSSSTSFCIVGIYVDTDNTESLLYKKYEKYCKDKKDEDLSFSDYLYDIVYPSDILSIYNGISNYDSDDCFIGFNVNRLKDDQTFKQFKEQICFHINELFGLEDKDKFKEKDLNIYLDGGYDG